MTTGRSHFTVFGKQSTYLSYTSCSDTESSLCSSKDAKDAAEDTFLPDEIKAWRRQIHALLAALATEKLDMQESRFKFLFLRPLYLKEKKIDALSELIIIDNMEDLIKKAKELKTQLSVISGIKSHRTRDLLEDIININIEKPEDSVSIKSSIHHK